jgi:predicted ATPase
MITKIELTNFKSHAHTVIEPGRVTALVGPNGCGKSSVLQALRCLTRVIDEPWDQVFKDSLKIDYLHAQVGSPTNIALQGDLYSSDEIWRLTCKFRLVPHSSSWQPSASWQLGIRENRESILSLGQSITNALVPAAYSQLPVSFYFKPSPQQLAEPSYSEKIPPVIESDGKGLASVIAHLVLDAPDQIRAIEDSLRKVVPTITKFGARFAKVKVKEKKIISVGSSQMGYDEEREVTGQEIFFDTLNGLAIPAHAMSDGTLVILGLLTLLYAPVPQTHFSPPTLILVDDIEAGLHPLAQRQLIQILKDFAEKHDRQIILTSHSPYIVDALDAKDIWVMATDKEGISHTKRLSDHPDAKRALDVLTTGELWDAEGESWVLENTPAELANA